MAYIGVSLAFWEPNPFEWSRVAEENTEKALYEQTKKIDSTFYEVAGRDSVIDYEEFRTFYKENIRK